MLGSVHDADDAVQETFVRAWRGIDGLRAGTSARSWLYSIATNVCLTELARRGRRALPHDFGPASVEGTPPGQPVVESTWLDPYPDALLRTAAPGPEATYEVRESVELAFVAALQHLPANQRAALLLRDVVGLSAAEAAAALDTSVASITSALARARSAVADRVPARSQQATVRALGDDALRALVDRYVDAWERNDVDAFAALLAEHASFAMPPLSTWYHPRDVVLTWARHHSLNGDWRWRAVPTSANGQPALGFYSFDEAAGAFLPFALCVLTLDGGLIVDVTAFIVRQTGAPQPNAYERFPDRPIDAARASAAFERFDLPVLLVPPGPGVG